MGISYLGLDGRTYPLDTDRCEDPLVSRARDAYGCLTEARLYSFTAPDGQHWVLHEHWEAPPHEVDYWEGTMPVNETAREIPEDVADRFKAGLGASPPEPVRTPPSRPNDARNAWLVEQWLAGMTAKQIALALRRDHPEWARLDDAGVHVNIQRYAKKHGIALPERKQKRQPNLRLLNKDSAEGC
jgi:hypothetical protein